MSYPTEGMMNSGMIAITDVEVTIVSNGRKTTLCQ